MHICMPPFVHVLTIVIRLSVGFRGLPAGQTEPRTWAEGCKGRGPSGASLPGQSTVSGGEEGRRGGLEHETFFLRREKKQESKIMMSVYMICICVGVLSSVCIFCVCVIVCHFHR